MFTGIVQSKTKITKKETKPFGLRLWIDKEALNFNNIRPVEIGDSICVSGVCLTVSELTEKEAGFDVIKETLEKTTIGEFEVEQKVNLEPAITANQPLGGHFMQGHVDGVGGIFAIRRNEKETRFTIKPPIALLDYIILKGSVALDGISLTIASIDEAKKTFDVALIPTTLEVTTLGQKQAGDNINIEADILAKTTVNFLRRQRAERGANKDNESIISKSILIDAGFC